MVGVSLVVLTGWGGNISLGQYGIVGIGALVAGNLIDRWNVDLFFVIARRRRRRRRDRRARWSGCRRCASAGLFLAVTTLAFAVALDAYFLNPATVPQPHPRRLHPRRCCGSAST